MAKLFKAKYLENTTLSVETVTGTKSYSSHLVKVKLPSKSKTVSINAYTIDEDLVKMNKCSDDIKALWPSLDDKISDEILMNSYEGPTHIVVGQDNIWRLGLTGILPHVNESIGIMKTHFGWSIAGNLAKSSVKEWQPNDDENRNQDNLIINVQRMDEIKTIEASLYDLFNKDEEIKNTNDYTYEEEYAMNNFFKNIQRAQDGRYSVAPMLKKNHVPLKNNYYLALLRYRNLRKSLNRNPEKNQAYNEALKCMLDNDEIEEVKEDINATKSMNRSLYYIPHSGVWKTDRITTAMRLVFDASAKNSEGISLNDNLLKGPKKQIDLIALLIKLRLNKIVLVGDISRMFYNIDIQERFRDNYRILWNFTNNEEEPKVYRFKKLIMGANDSPCLAISTVHYPLIKLAKKIQPLKRFAN